MQGRELETEFEYYIGQSLLWRVEKLSRDLREVHLVLGLDKPVVHLNKFDRLLQYLNIFNSGWVK